MLPKLVRYACFYIMILLAHSTCVAAKDGMKKVPFLPGDKIRKDWIEPEGNFNTLVIPIRKLGNLIVVEAKIDDQFGNFILDTGAPWLVLNSTYFTNTYATESTFEGVTGEGGTVMRTRIKQLQIRSLVYKDLEPDVVSLRHLENKRGIKILGLLGMNLLKRLEWELDLKEDILILRKLGKGGVPLDAATAIPDSTKPSLQMEIDTRDNRIVVNAACASKKLSFILDTGAEINVLSDNISRKVLETFKNQRKIKLNGSGLASAEVFAGTLNEVIIGTKSFQNMAFILTNFGNSFNRSVDGILGYDWFSMGRLKVNMQRKELSFYLYTNE
jgi:predicted aspartyl protease